MQGYAAVVGGVNVDISGTPATAMLGGDSNPGTVEQQAGGVGRNIAENLVRLGCQTSMVTVIGDDWGNTLVRTHCELIGLDLSYAETLKGERTGTYLCLNDANGDLYAAVSDMAINRCITPEWLKKRLPFLQKAQFIVVDANIPEESVIWLAENVNVPLVADPVSVKKAPRLRPVLGKLAMMKPNRAEAQMLTGIATDSIKGVEAAAEALLALGVKNVFISLGEFGVYFASKEKKGIQPTIPGDIINTNGCGDAFLAAAALSMANGDDIARMAKIGQAASSVCAASSAAVSPKMNMTLISRLVG